MIHNNLPQKLWGEAANTAVYLLNRSINSVTKTKTPYELYFGRIPRVDHLRVFGCVAFMKLIGNATSQGKLANKSIKVIMVGYDRDFTYRLFEPSSLKVYISREVVFDEGKSLYEGKKKEYKIISELIEENGRYNADGIKTAEVSVASLSSFSIEPTDYKEAISCDDSEQWNAAMKEEYASLIANDTWEVVRYDASKITPIKCKWVYKIKYNANGSIGRYKARLVAKGYSQKPNIDYNETFSPVVRLESVRLILSLVAKMDLEMIHFDVKTAFLNGKLNEEIYMQEPEGFKTGTNLACKLKKSLYGLKQASRVWNQTFVDSLNKFDMKQLRSDSCVFVRRGRETLIIAIYVDDGLVCASNKELLGKVVEHLKQQFEITVLDARCFVGLEITRSRQTKKLFVSQQAYAKRILDKYNLQDCNALTLPMTANSKYVKTGVAQSLPSKTFDGPYREALGSIMYLMIGSRPDIACAVSILSRFCSEPKVAHWEAMKNLLRYIKGTTGLGLMFRGSDEQDLVGYADADYGSCIDTRKSISGMVVKHYSAPIVWKSTKQSTVAESTTEAEFVACSLASREVVWLRNFLEELTGAEPTKQTTLYCDNQSAIRFVNEKQITSKIKHVDIRLHAIRGRVETRKIDVKYIRSQDQQADILTKPVSSKNFKYLLEKLGMMTLLLMCMCSIVNADSKLSLLENVLQFKQAIVYHDNSNIRPVQNSIRYGKYQSKDHDQRHSFRRRRRNSARVTELL